MTSAASPAILFILTSSPFAHYWHRLVDPTFRGLYQVNAFDLTIMLPYFAVMAVLATYGIHRYALVYNFYKYRRNVPGPPPQVTSWPKVTVQLPIYNERYVTERLVEAVSQFDYPSELLQIQLLDDSTDETKVIARDCVERYCALGVPIEYIHRDNRSGFKAGALQEGLKTATGDFVAIFDADFIPPADFLRRTVPYFADTKLAMVQTRWSYINRNYSALTEVEAILLDGHFAIEHSSRYRSGVFFNFNGTAGVWRRAAIDDAGGWQHDTLTEDTDLSYRAQIRGWHFLYLARNRLPLGTARGDERFQVAAGALGQGLDANGEKDPAAGDARKPSYGSKGRSFLPSDRKHQLSADDFHVHDSAAGDDRALLSGLVSGAGDRSAVVFSLNLLHFFVLPSC